MRHALLLDERFLPRTKEEEIVCFAGKIRQYADGIWSDGTLWYGFLNYSFLTPNFINFDVSYVDRGAAMLRKVNSYDNAIAENFFSILKTECIYRHKPRTFQEANDLIDRYIHFYNHARIQNKTGVAPLTFNISYLGAFFYCRTIWGSSKRRMKQRHLCSVSLKAPVPVGNFWSASLSASSSAKINDFILNSASNS